MKAGTVLRDPVRRAWRRAGWAGWLGLALLLLALAIDLLAVPAIELRRQALSAERTRLLQGSETAGGLVLPAGTAEFYGHFPTVQDLPQLLTRLHAMGDEHGLDLSRSDYRSADEPGTPLVRVALHLPVHGEFAAIYGWLDEVLRAMPAVGLEALSVRRSDAEIAPVDADLRLVVFVRRQP
ncbi:hypothetical protein CJ010_02515 [Azoarcus sp. DD4]|uniref:GspMb/PilO family protein n=1 Tax=Azoarcus sp. DD4 TaxID=2027405 RepID=UPI00112A9D4D|nr:GspMb/PilO family protein [Azoarcus sp. DD4]QDF95503.1 hypothetical protein CJ010_02515 [Azoarcus sp. DD4]